MERRLALELSSSLMEDALELRMASLATSFADFYACLAAPVLLRRYRRSMRRRHFLACIASLESWLLELLDRQLLNRSVFVEENL